jgi:hypothetical protein
MSTISARTTSFLEQVQEIFAVEPGLGGDAAEVEREAAALPLGYRYNVA